MDESSAAGNLVVDPYGGTISNVDAQAAVGFRIAEDTVDSFDRVRAANVAYQRYFVAVYLLGPAQHFDVDAAFPHHLFVCRGQGIDYSLAIG